MYKYEIRVSKIEDSYVIINHGSYEYDPCIEKCPRTLKITEDEYEITSFVAEINVCKALRRIGVD